MSIKESQDWLIFASALLLGAITFYEGEMVRREWWQYRERCLKAFEICLEERKDFETCYTTFLF